MLVPSLIRTAPGWVAPNRRIYAVGDVHGCAGRLDHLHARIAMDLEDRPVAHALLIHLGDFIDRGPDSAGVIARLASGSPLPGLPMVALRGNHEQMLLDAATGNPDVMRHWCGNGGDAALRSWGLENHRKDCDWVTKLPARDFAFIQTLPMLHQVDGYVFVHAGVRPGVPLDDQVPDDLLWIRKPFLDSTGPLLPDAPRVAVVHGHTPQAEPVITSNRIGIDTGAVMGGPLTCAVLEGAGVSFIAVPRH